MERRRSLKAYHLSDGEREFDVWLESDKLGLRGRVDMVITRRGRRRVPAEVIPVEYKDSPGRGGPGWMLQLAAYGVMLEAMRGLAARRGFVYYIPQRRAREFALTAELKARVVAIARVRCGRWSNLSGCRRRPLSGPSALRASFAAFATMSSFANRRGFGAENDLRSK